MALEAGPESLLVNASLDPTKRRSPAGRRLLAPGLRSPSPEETEGEMLPQEEVVSESGEACIVAVASPRGEAPSKSPIEVRTTSRLPTSFMRLA